MSMQNGVLLNLMLMNKEGLVRGVKFGDSLGYSDYEIVEFGILHEGSRTASKIATLDFWRVNFSFLGIFLEESHGDQPCR